MSIEVPGWWRKSACGYNRWILMNRAQIAREVRKQKRKYASAAKRRVRRARRMAA